MTYVNNKCLEISILIITLSILSLPSNNKSLYDLVINQYIDIYKADEVSKNDYIPKYLFDNYLYILNDLHPTAYSMLLFRTETSIS